MHVCTFLGIIWKLLRALILLSKSLVMLCRYACLQVVLLFEIKLRPFHHARVIILPRLLDRLLHPCWAEPKLLEDVVQAKAPGSMCEALSTIKGFGGDLLFSHTLEYLQLFDADACPPVLGCHMSKPVVADFVRGGKNSQAFVRIANAASQRSSEGSSSMKTLCAAVDTLLPDTVLFSDGSTTCFPHFYVTDGSQNACKAMQVYQTFLTGAWNGKQRGVVPAKRTRLGRTLKVMKRNLKSKR